MIILQIKPQTVLKKLITLNSPAMIIGLLLVLVAIGVFWGFKETVKPKRFKKKGALLYALCYALCFAIISLIAALNPGRPQIVYYILLVIFLGLGILHNWMMYLMHSWSDKQSFWPEAFFTLFVASLGGALFIILFYLFSKSYQLAYSPSLFVFLLPFFVAKAYYQWMKIPRRTYVGWVYPESRPDLNAYNAARLQGGSGMYIYLIISEESVDNSYPSRLRIKVSPKYTFGTFFQVWFIERKGDKTKNPIKFHRYDEQGNTVSWIFYVKPKSRWQRRIYLDPDLSFEDNLVNEADEIVALRVVGDVFHQKDVKSVKEYEGESLEGTTRQREPQRPLRNNASNNRITIKGDKKIDKQESSDSSITIKKRNK